MTYSILAKCTATGRFGMAIATYSVAVGQWCDGLDRRAGIAMSQAFVRPTNNALALNLLRQGHSATFVTDALVRDDDFPEYRQIGIIAPAGRPAGHTGVDTRPWAGHVVGADYIAMGNVLAGERVVQEMARTFEASAGASLELRLLDALSAGRSAGGQSSGSRALPERSSALIATASDSLDAVNIRVDLHDDCVNEIRRVYSVCSRYSEYYRRRGIHPVDALPQEVFEKEHGLPAA